MRRGPAREEAEVVVVRLQALPLLLHVRVEGLEADRLAESGFEGAATPPDDLHQLRNLVVGEEHVAVLVQDADEPLGRGHRGNDVRGKATGQFVEDVLAAEIGRRGLLRARLAEAQRVEVQVGRIAAGQAEGVPGDGADDGQ